MATRPDLAVEKETNRPSPLTEGDISLRTGNCNVLLIAPHGRPEDDTNTGKLTREFAELLDCYAVINEKYIKTSTAGVPEADPENFIADLYKQSEANLPELKPLFLDWINQYKKDIINKFGSLFIIHVHGIKTENVPKVAKLIPEYKKIPNKLQAVIGYGQWRNNLSKPTADLELTVEPFISRLMENGLQAAIAPVEPIKVDGRDTWYCGWDDERLNQYLYDPKVSMQSFQIELKEAGVRDKPIPRSKAAKALAAAIKPFLVSAVQRGSVQQIPVSEIDLENGKFMSRLDDIASIKPEFQQLIDSIKRHGILNPIIVRRNSDTDGKSYQLISGFRRLTALRASITEKDANVATVDARVLNDSITEDEAYQISFTENLARQDLSLWEIAQACAKIMDQKIAEGGMRKGQIEKHLAELIQKDSRTIRRYLKLSSIKNKDITEAVHTGDITPTTALDLGKKELNEDDIAALLLHINKFPKTTRTFVQFYNNLEVCSKWSKLSIAIILNCPNADKFLSLEKKELLKRIVHRKKGSGKPVSEVLRGEAGSLVKLTKTMDFETARKAFIDQFASASQSLSDGISNALKDSEIDAQFTIESKRKNRISFTISAPVEQIHKAMKLAALKTTKKNVKEIAALLEKKPNKTEPKLQFYTEAEWDGAIASMGRLVDIRNFPDAAAKVLLGQGEAFLGPGYKGPRKALNPEIIGALTFWTKGPVDLLIEHPGLRQVLELYNQNRSIIGLQLSVTGLGGTLLEPGIQSPEEIAVGLKKVIDTGLIIPEAVQLRYDPLVAIRAPDGRIIRNDTPEAFQKVASLFSQLGVKVVETKFLLLGEEGNKYNHVLKRMKEAGVTPLPYNEHDIQKVFSGMSDVAVRYGMQIFSCCVSQEQNLPGWTHDSGCLSAERLTQAAQKKFGADWERLPQTNRASRLGCQCSRYFDLSNIKGHKKCGSQDAACLYCTACSKVFGKTVKEKLAQEIEAFKKGERDDYYVHLLK